MNKEHLAALQNVIDYNWGHELRDYVENYPDSGRNHIFVDLVILDNLLNGTKHKPEYYLPGEY